MAAHPDDAELGCGGTIAKQISMGYKVGVLDFTRGELGTRGTTAIRAAESEDAARILDLSVRENLGLRDGFFSNCEEDQLKVIRAVRKYKPEIVLANAIKDRHPDHGKGAVLGYDACFLAGLVKIITTDESGKEQLPWRPKAVYHFIQSEFIEPDFIIDISDFWNVKMEAIRAYKSQFYDPKSTEPVTYISTPDFLRKVESRAIELGHAIGTRYGEGFTARRYPGIKNLFDLF